MKKLISFLVFVFTALCVFSGNPRSAQYDDDTGDIINPAGLTLKFGGLEPDDYFTSADADSKADLDETGRVPVSQLPAIAITNTYTVDTESAQLALEAQEGDVCIRSDISKSYIQNGGTAGTMADWSELLTPTDQVTSVNGRTGTITLSKSDVGLTNCDNTSDTDKIVSTATQNALNAKLDSSAFILPITGTTVAVGTGANADSPAVAVGVSANAATSGVAVGYAANANSSGAAVGYQANGNGSASAVGYQANGYSNGAAVGIAANGTTSGAVVGRYSNGYSYGAAIGRSTNGYNYAIALGYAANANVDTASSSDSPKIAIGYGVNNDQNGPSLVSRGDLYLSQGKKIAFRQSNTGTYNPIFYAHSITSLSAGAGYKRVASLNLNDGRKVSLSYTLLYRYGSAYYTLMADIKGKASEFFIDLTSTSDNGSYILPNLRIAYDGSSVYYLEVQANASYALTVDMSALTGFGYAPLEYTDGNSDTAHVTYAITTNQRRNYLRTGGADYGFAITGSGMYMPVQTINVDSTSAPTSDSAGTNGISFWVGDTHYHKTASGSWVYKQYDAVTP